MITQERHRTVAVVLAGGIGQRMGLNTPKQLLEIAGRTILEHTLDTFDAHPDVDEIVMVMAPGFVDDAAELVRRNGYAKVSRVLEGGASRTESSWRALRALGEQECDVLLHDAVRPLVEPRVVADCVAALQRHEAVEVAIPSSDTILVAAEVPDGEVLQDVPDRARLRRAQTPQGFRLSVIRTAYERAFADPEFAARPATDDCGVVLRYLPDVPIHLVAGSEQNMKVTHPVDAHIAESLLRLREGAAPARSDDECRSALDGRTLVVFGSGYGIADLAKRYGASVHVFPRTPGGVLAEDAASVEGALAEVQALTGRVDYVVNASAEPVAGRLDEIGPRDAEEAVRAGCLGPVVVARASAAHLTRTGGHLLFLTAPAPGGAVASSVRAAVVGLARELAAEWAPQGVRVNVVECAALGADAEAVARAGVDVLASPVTGRVVDARR
ncbi:pyrophosphorylase [Planotetraspora thailandica]|uniref:2-C-methyl-D-erythritol 4-phosphate cytidylyltransferase n=1 Tax=Planotetraspora thailandica TaxID=487172 RepID=A0A8J3XXP5_9ACTN|nr:bifunctional cytidylyltransferase/SDR family oxidoreductase [Planotetraspora thailandica]GII53268.1 pyrophosphorylase [Planotetraspora thailandica]